MLREQEQVIAQSLQEVNGLRSLMKVVKALEPRVVMSLIFGFSIVFLASVTKATKKGLVEQNSNGHRKHKLQVSSDAPESPLVQQMAHYEAHAVFFTGCIKRMK